MQVIQIVYHLIIKTFSYITINNMNLSVSQYKKFYHKWGATNDKACRTKYGRSLWAHTQHAHWYVQTMLLWFDFLWFVLSARCGFVRFIHPYSSGLRLPQCQDPPVAYYNKARQITTRVHNVYEILYCGIAIIRRGVWTLKLASSDIKVVYSLCVENGYYCLIENNGMDT